LNCFNKYYISYFRLMAENNLIKPNWSIHKHHCIPISTGGEDLKQNFARVIDRDHKQIHDTLDIPMRFYSDKVRKIKEKTNHHIITKPETIDLWWDLQKEYFSRIHQLPRHLQKIHMDSMLNMVQYWATQYMRMSNDNILWEREPKGNTLSYKFHESHSKYLEVKKEITKEIYLLLSKWKN